MEVLQEENIRALEGIVNVLKPPGMTSSNVVSDIRRLFGLKRVGHTGTLDPGAAGVLPVCLGRATRLFDLLMDKRKVYIAEISFGACTDTQDSYGTVTRRSAAHVSQSDIQAALPAFVGRQTQRTPRYSAAKVNGRAMHSIARSGGEVPERLREIEVYALAYIERIADARHLIRIECASGTYVRQLLEDIGDALGVCAHMSFLLRAASGMFRVEQSYSIARLERLREAAALETALVPVEKALEFLPAIHVTAREELALMHGKTVSGAYGGGLSRVFGSRFLGVGEAQANALKLKLHF